jgi:hypothetical protein
MIVSRSAALTGQPHQVAPELPSNSLAERDERERAAQHQPRRVDELARKPKLDDVVVEDREKRQVDAVPTFSQ